ncbi:ABC transporter permease subunit [Fictibacillus nanhaiensis]|uniref:ABC transporter permease subunit n=1 Tax=Fictibacillus nanhaiensis TaxID=742169 RepID=UPI001C956754|nr:ABC transporter permease subunit [Fictibacillus nanhaiensis]MBY6035799.1 ABC transporter permease subunit [Fictibacillus nanhaiensis]
MKWYKKNNHYLLLSPALIFTVCLVGCGLIMAFLESIRAFESPSFDTYQELLAGETFITSLLYSLCIALFSTLISIIIGLLLVRSTFPVLKRLFPKLIAWTPMVFPHFVWGYMLFLLFSQSGYFSSLLNLIGLMDDKVNFPILFKDPFGIGIILTYVWKEVPFVILILMPVYEQLSRSQKELVYTLGGKSWDVFWHVERPYVFPVLYETFFIIFTFVVSAYEVPALLGATYPKMISVLTFDWFFGSDWTKQPDAFAAMILLTLMTVFIVFILFTLTKNRRIFLIQTNGENKEYSKAKKYEKLFFLLIAISTFLPLTLVFITSLTKKWEYGHLLPDFISTRGWHVLLVNSPQLQEAVLTSMGICILVLIINLLLGIPAAKGLAFYEFRGKSLIETILLTPILIPAIAIAMGVHLTFIRLGLANHWSGVALVHLLPTLPYTIKILRAGYERIGKQQEEVAISLGGHPLRIFQSVYLPQLMPSIRSLVFLVTVISLSQYFLTALIGGGAVTTMAILFFPYFKTADDSVIASFSILFAIIPIVIYLMVEVIFRLILPKQTR